MEKEKIPAIDEPNPRHSPNRPTYIVGIGASAGGLEALEQFFKAMPPESGMAFVIVQHLSPDFKSLMDELLSHRTEMAIHRVEDGMDVEADALYLIPPRKEMIISGGKLLLTDKDPTQALTLPIDQFFRSLAQDAGRDAIGIILSGTGSDGSRGIRDIHDAGGLIIAQSEESAKFDGMPRSAIDTGVVDLVLSPEKIPAALLRYISHPMADTLPEQDGLVPATGMSRLFQVLRDQYNIDFSHYKPSTVGRRIERRLLMNQTSDLEEYISRIVNDPNELNALYKDLLIGVTKLFRDQEAFRKLASDVLPQLLMASRPREEFRVWVAGCATGEEAYSLAILLHEQIESTGRPLNVKIFATDVHRASIDFASAGIYPEASMSEVEPRRLERYFVRKGSGYQVSQELRQMIVFAQHNIIRDAPFTKLDLISCRNLLIYLQPNAQKKCLSLFHFGLMTGGILFLGPSESPAELGDEFDTIDPHWKMYRKRRDIRLPSDLRLPLTLQPTQLHASALGSSSSSRSTDGVLGETYSSLLRQFMPPSLLIDERRDLVHTFGGAERYLHIQGGKTSTNLLDLVNPDLRIALSGALNRAQKDQSDVTFSGVLIEVGGSHVRLDISVHPIEDRRGTATYSLIALNEAASKRIENGAATPHPDMDLHAASQDRLNDLESELRYAKENLQSAIEEMETSNEELQATNEELVASNEELQSTNEELHSVNEELYTVNAEYQRKIAELTQLTSDMDNLLRSTEIGTIFLDCDLCIRKFTPQIAQAFNLMPQDVGRRIDTFTHTIDQPNLIGNIETVLETGEPFEGEVRDRQRHWHFLRILPYRSLAGEIEGAVVTLIDISNLKRAEARLHETNRQLSGVLDNSMTFISIKDLNGKYQLCNRASVDFLGQTSAEVEGKTDHDLLPAEYADKIKANDREVGSSGRIAEFEEVVPGATGPQTYLSVKFPLRDDSGNITAIGSVCTNITDRKRIEQHQRDAVTRRDQFLAMLSHELRTPLGAIVNAAHVMDHPHAAENLDQTRHVIHRQAHHMARLLDDLLDVSRVTQGKIEMRHEVFDLRQAAEDAIDAIKPVVESRTQSLSIQLPDEPVYVDGDSARLQQIQVNLLANASKYNGDAGQIWFSIQCEGGMAIIRVRDNGAGISEEDQTRIFDLFVQSATTIGRADGGMGVGLTLVRSIVEKHGGTVSVRSAGPGHGSEFIVTIPTTAKRPIKQSSHSGNSLEAQKTRVLIVEDNPDAREMLSMLLRLDGYQVLTAGDGAEGVEAIEQERPDVALVDIGLPEMTGLELARRIRSDSFNDGSFLIALTGYGQASDREAALQAGFDAHLVKPLDTAELSSLISNRSKTKSQAK